MAMRTDQPYPSKEAIKEAEEWIESWNVMDPGGQKEREEAINGLWDTTKSKTRNE